MTNFSISSSQGAAKGGKTWEVNICDKHKIRLISMSSSRRWANEKKLNEWIKYYQCGLIQGGVCAWGKFMQSTQPDCSNANCQNDDGNIKIMEFVNLNLKFFFSLRVPSKSVFSRLWAYRYTPGFLNDCQRGEHLSESISQKQQFKWCAERFGDDEKQPLSY